MPVEVTAPLVPLVAVLTSCAAVLGVLLDMLELMNAYPLSDSIIYRLGSPRLERDS